MEEGSIRKSEKWVGLVEYKSTAHHVMEDVQGLQASELSEERALIVEGESSIMETRGRGYGSCSRRWFQF